MPDGTAFTPLYSNLAQATKALEGWATNATETFLSAQGTSPRDQWLRKINLTVYGQVGPVADKQGGLDLSQLRIEFDLHKTTNSSPNLLHCKVYNLSPKTRDRVKQYQRIQLAAGYQQGNFGMLFDGTVILYVQGKDSAVDTYLEIFAGDADELQNNAAVTLNFAKGATPEDKVRKALIAANIPVGEINLGQRTINKAARASAFIGPVHAIIRDQTNATKSDYFIDDGKAYVISWEGYRQGEVVVLTPQTGLVGIPKVTPDGIEATCLLNPKLRLAGLMEVKSSQISGVPFLPGSSNPYNQQSAGPLNSPVSEANPTGQFPAYPGLSPTGLYKILFLTFTGDTRGNPWYAIAVGTAAGPDGKKIDDKITTPMNRSAAYDK